uniref:DUF4260 domain-containing protein n=1 Tax=Virgibacillus oceani TaxID=1479511 RepID=A0A917M9J3_9BACI|nr:hypothetical protein GCM10011398_31590 [Virgibacillus oceani]
MSIYFYARFDFSWIMFFILLLSPDLSMFGYAVDKRTGAIVYNIFHSYIVPIILILLALIIANNLLLAIGIIWVAHIGMDRTAGYGLKYPADFKDTHLQRVG